MEDTLVSPLPATKLSDLAALIRQLRCEVTKLRQEVGSLRKSCAVRIVSSRNNSLAERAKSLRPGFALITSKARMTIDSSLHCPNEVSGRVGLVRDGGITVICRSLRIAVSSPRPGVFASTTVRPSPRVTRRIPNRSRSRCDHIAA
jgi:hypothetical protein